MSAEQLVCARCLSDDDVKLVSPDMDIRPVPLCVLCRWTIDWLEEDGRG